MSITVHDFEEFFALVNVGNKPFAWQTRLLHQVATTGLWPTRIAAPTGSGKSAVVDIHVYVCALSAVGLAPRVPRRLAPVVGRRALVDSQAGRAEHIRSVLASSEDGVGLLVRQALERLVPDAPERFLQLVQLRGALAPTTDWLNDPRPCSVINATPDMWGSRLLLRGYGSSSRAWPREAGLLAYDAVMVLDEAHLNRQLLCTAQAVARLASQSPIADSVPALQVVETTATPASDSIGGIGVLDTDLDDQQLADRLCLPKPVNLVATDQWPKNGTASKAYVSMLADLTVSARDKSPDRPVGCIVNRVDTAVRTAAELTARGLRVECWVGPMRPMDLASLQLNNPGLFDPAQASAVDVLVATQTVEVGVDLDLGALVTELSPGSALAQRAGRVNRRGLLRRGPISVLVPIGDVARDVPPYLATDLVAAHQWLNALASSPDGLSPWAIGSNPPPQQSLQRGMVKRPQLHDAIRWADTSMPMLADEDLPLWLRDSLEVELQPCGLVIRAPLPDNDDEAISLLLQTPPATEETFPTSIKTLRAVVDSLLSGEGSSDPRVFLWRDDGVTRLASSDELRPGCTVIVPAGLQFVQHRVVVPEPLQNAEMVETRWGSPETKVLVAGSSSDPLLHLLAGMDPEEAQSFIDDGDEWSGWQVVLPPSELCSDDLLPWLVLVPRAVVNNDEDERQLWTTSQRMVTLSAHSQAVAQRAAVYAKDVGLPSDLVDACVLAGRLHDQGKSDQRFQRSLRAGGEVLAKSGMRSAQEIRRARAASGLPTGWRHEHLSAAHVPADCDQSDLVARLVGTSHGHGRGLAIDSSASLIGQATPPLVAARVVELFDEGDWYSILDRTTQHFGVWGCAFLEAVLRAADCQVSKEGS